MNGAFYVGAIGLESQQRALDMIANNIANINTPTFKRSDIRFTEIMSSQINQLDAAITPLNERNKPAGVVSSTEFLLFEQGKLRNTGRPGDLAIQGSGFVELLGPGGQIMLWRGGSLKVNEEGLLSASNDMPLKALISVSDDISEVQVRPDGRVIGLSNENGRELEMGQINLVRINDSRQVERLDGGLYALIDGERVTEAAPGEDGMGLLVQGSIEGSNVELTDEMVQMMLVQRAFASNAQIVQAADQMMSIANSLRR